MRNLLVGVVGLLMLAVPALADNTLALTGPAAVEPGAAIQLVISVTDANIAIDSWGGNLTATGPGVVTIEGYTVAAYTSGPVGGWGLGFQGMWDTAGQPLPVDNIGDFNLSNTQLTGQIFTAKLFADLPGVYTISLADAYTGSSLGDAGLTSVADYTVEVLPEPVSALLLLAGLPMLRRRR